MDPVMKAKWLEALRSGKYKQGRYCLRNKENSFCCLGVLCDVYDNTKWEIVRTLYEFVLVSDRYAYNLPEELIYRYDIKNIATLVTMNDEGQSFEEIAKYIEENM